ncbi:MAG: 3-oxoacyl-ACP reductase FabG [Fidelibacterota bacterium]
MFNLESNVAIVTGASRGIGQGIAEELAAAGATVICVSRSADAVAKVAGKIQQAGHAADSRACDVAAADSWQELVYYTLEKYGHIDILVNNAGVTKDTLLMRMSEQDWDLVLDINLKGSFNGIKAVTRPMMKNRFGRIINISSVVGLTGNAGQVNYAASKAGIIGLTKATAKELASRGITVNCVAPGYIETDMTEAINEKAKALLLNQIPLGRIGSVNDIAHMVHYLSSREAGYITGQTFTVDGGMTMI